MSVLRGKVKKQIEEAGYKCPACDGTGTYFVGCIGERCYKCNGKGVMVDADKILAIPELAIVDRDRPKIVCLCGSTRFMDTFFEVGWELTLKGYIVLSVGVCKHAEDHGAEALGQDVAEKLDELHLRKIDMADEVWILNVGGYIGKSTMKELEYARSEGKKIVYLENCSRQVG